MTIGDITRENISKLMTFVETTNGLSVYLKHRVVNFRLNRTEENRIWLRDTFCFLIGKRYPSKRVAEFVNALYARFLTDESVYLNERR